MSLTYRALRFWSPTTGCNAVRLSMYDARGGEHYAVIPQAGTGMQNKEARFAALDAIADAIEQGRDPGAVPLTAEVANG